MIAVDYFFKWFDIKKIKTKKATEIIKKLKELFVTHGIPEVLIADNIPFSSLECKDFAKTWEFEIKTSSPRYPQSNGLTKKNVGIAKQLLKKCLEQKEDWDKVLLHYKNTSLAEMDILLAQVLLSRQLRNLVPVKKKILRPVVQTNVCEKITSAAFNGSGAG